ncbi:MAG: 3-oxoacyl-[acyl-carrier-protein] reductase [Thermodesulfovibrionales bacterium]
MNIDLNGKIALVTGGSRGIGRQCCIGLAAAGATVVVNYNRSADKAEELKQEIISRGGRAEIFKADLSSPEEAEKIFAHIRSAYGRLDILVNNAGIVKDNLMLSMDIRDWDRVIDLNLRAAFVCTRLAAEMMLTNHAGKIVNIASVSGIRGGKGQVNYAAAKGGLISFTRACALELASKGIQVNSVLPGFIVTDMSSRVRKRAGDKILEFIPAGRFGEPADVANMVVFLASDKADYITGQAMVVDGGLSVL